jgi:hypothetical protein
VDRVHGAVDRQPDRVQSGPASGADNGHGGASPVHCACA